MSLSLFLRRHHSAYCFWVQNYRKKFNLTMVQTHFPLKKTHCPFRINKLHILKLIFKKKLL